MARKIFSYLLGIKAITVLIMFALLFVYYLQVFFSYNVRPNYWIPLVLLVPGMVVPALLWKSVRSGRKNRWAPIVFYVESVYTIIIAYLYFSEVMHDIALAYFGHHGRFGLVDLDGGGSPYLVDGSTLPIILFVPVLIAGTVHFIRSWRENNNGPGIDEGRTI